MNLFVLLIYLLIMILLPPSIFVINKVDWLKNDSRFIAKKLLDFLMYGINFALIVFTNYIVIYYNRSLILVIVSIVICLSLSVYALYIFTQQIVNFSHYTIVSNKKIFLLIVVSLLFGILMSMSTINYTLYMICPNFYEIQCGLSFIEIAFEFIYYSFTLAVTYSSSSISAIHIITKLVQMIEIIYFYILCGSLIIDIISNINKKNKK